MKIRYFHCPEGYLAVTSETPDGPFEGVLYVGRGPAPGGGIDTIHEQMYEKAKVLKLPRCPADKVPDDWFSAFGYEKRQPPPPPAPLPKFPDYEPLPCEPRYELPVTELVIGSSCETPALDRIIWLVVGLVLLSIHWRWFVLYCAFWGVKRVWKSEFSSGEVRY